MCDDDDDVVVVDDDDGNEFLVHHCVLLHKALLFGFFFCTCLICNVIHMAILLGAPHLHHCTQPPTQHLCVHIHL